jgi:hypothetical protein
MKHYGTSSKWDQSLDLKKYLFLITEYVLKFWLNVTLISVILHEQFVNEMKWRHFVLKKALFVVLISPYTHFELVWKENVSKLLQY